MPASLSLLAFTRTMTRIAGSPLVDVRPGPFGPGEATLYTGVEREVAKSTRSRLFLLAVNGGRSRSLLQEAGGLLVAVEGHQQGRLLIADGLVVVGVQAEHLGQDIGGLVEPALVGESDGQARHGPHIGAGFEDAPELADLLGEEFRRERAPGGADAAAKPLLSLFEVTGVVAQHPASVGAVGRDLQGLPGQLHAAPSVGGEGLVA